MDIESCGEDKSVDQLSMADRLSGNVMCPKGRVFVTSKCGDYVHSTVCTALDQLFDDVFFKYI